MNHIFRNVTTSNVLLIACLLLAPSRAAAAIILETSGPPFTGTGIGRGNGQQAGAIGFSTQYRLEDVTFTVPLSYTTTGLPPHTVHSYLTDSIGPGTTPANLLAQDSLVINGGQSGEFQVMSYPALDPGTYYLMLIDFDLNLVGWGNHLASQATVTGAPGVQLVASLGYAQETGSFPPAFEPNGDTRDATIFATLYSFRIEGTAIPEPTSIALVTIALSCCLVARRSSRAST